MSAEYYAQRAGAGLILSEATPVSQRGEGFYGSACLYNQKHVEGWKLVTKAVHDKGGIIFIQSVHAGRATHPTINKGLQAYGPSPFNRREPVRGTNEDYPIPKEMTLDDIEEAKNEFLNSFKLAKEAGFDGVQVHGAHGYLVDSFLKSSSNQRKDAYGGSAENRCRFALEVVDLAVSVFGAQRVGMKLSPVARVGDVIDDNPL
jgi:N-ethylmaleimide reductase